MEAFDALCAAAQQPHSLALMTVKTTLGNQSHFVVSVITKNNHAIPVAIIPNGGLSVGEYLKYFDTMAAQVGGAEQDPDFKGVRM